MSCLSSTRSKKNLMSALVGRAVHNWGGATEPEALTKGLVSCFVPERGSGHHHHHHQEDRRHSFRMAIDHDLKNDTPIKRLQSWDAELPAGLDAKKSTIMQTSGAGAFVFHTFLWRLLTSRLDLYNRCDKHTNVFDGIWNLRNPRSPESSLPIITLRSNGRSRHGDR